MPGRKADRCFCGNKKAALVSLHTSQRNPQIELQLSPAQEGSQNHVHILPEDEKGAIIEFLSF